MDPFNPYASLPARAFWRSAVGELDPLEISGLYKKRFDISPDARIVTAGSCFAQHIGRNLKQRGFAYRDLEPPPPALPQDQHARYGYGIYSARYGNIYTARQLVQLVQESFGRFTPKTRIWEDGGRYYDPFRPSIEPNGFASVEELLALRERQHLPAVRRAIREAEIFVFTLGLTEAWMNEEDGSVYPTCPGTIAGRYDENIHKFHNFNYDEIYTDMLRFLRFARSKNPGLRFLLTVSPVPLTATASDQHILSATTYSKSVLRAVAGTLYAQFDFVDYFPSYELITAPVMGGRFYKPNMREVTPEGVAHVMSQFFVEHGESATQTKRPSRLARRAENDDYLKEIELICEEEKLDAVIGN